MLRNRQLCEEVVLHDVPGGLKRHGGQFVGGALQNVNLARRKVIESRLVPVSLFERMPGQTGFFNSPLPMRPRRGGEPSQSGAATQEPTVVPAPVDPKPLWNIAASPWPPVRGLHPAAFWLAEGALGSQGGGAV